MRKIAINFLFGYFSIFIFEGIVYAFPVQYTFSGHVIQGPGLNDTAGYLSQLGITVGSAVSYTFIVDLDAPGYIVQNNGTITTSSEYDNFYVSYISGTTLTSDTFIDSYNGITQYNVGNQHIGQGINERNIFSGNGNNYLYLYDLHQNPDSNGIFSSLYSSEMSNAIYDGNGNYSRYWFDGQITTATPLPVPEPSTFVLCGLGLFGLCYFVRRKNC